MHQTFPSIVFVGVHREAVDPLRWLVKTGERLVGLVTLEPEVSAKVSGAVDLTSLVAPAGVPIRLVRNVNEPACVAWIRAVRPDVLLVVGWTQLVREELLAVPTVACLGFHASLLPRYRGRAPINWALIHGETETGNTMIVLDPAADAGDIVTQRRIPITEEDDCGTLYEKVAATEVDMLAEVLPLIRAGTLPRRKQDESQATVMPRRRPADGVIDWTLPAPRIFNWVRALAHPYPGASTSSPSGTILVWRCAKVSPDAAILPSSPPGTVALDVDGWPLVAAGEGWVRVLRVQHEDEPEMSAREAASTYLRPGTRLGTAAGA